MIKNFWKIKRLEEGVKDWVKNEGNEMKLKRVSLMGLNLFEFY